ncbi:MAG: SprT-like domain-containing protein [Bacteroidales bacterium]|nr:SprT-like domain-containing protein [Candidatus Liminaster caballi]
MKPTIAFIEQKFDEFNQQMFDGKLPKIPVRLSNAKTFLGMCTFKKRRKLFGKVENYDFQLRFNIRIDLPEEEIEDVIIHEMIHYYIGVNQLKDTSAHGQLFRQMMNGINTRYGRHLTISHKSTPEQRQQLMDKRQRWRVVAVVRFADGHSGVKVLPRVKPTVRNYYNSVRASRTVSSVDLYLTDNVFFNRFPCSAALNVFKADEEEVQAELKAAIRLQETDF